MSEMCERPDCVAVATFHFGVSEGGTMWGRDWSPGETLHACAEHATEDIYRPSRRHVDYVVPRP